MWDLRSAACTHVLGTKSEGGLQAVALAGDGGAPFCFAAQRGAEAVLCFDLRMRRCLYELGTGNAEVEDMQVRRAALRCAQHCTCKWRRAMLLQLAVLRCALRCAEGTVLACAAASCWPTAPCPPPAPPQWHAPSRSLLVATSLKYDRHDHDDVDGVSWPQAMHRPSDFPCA